MSIPLSDLRGLPHFSVSALKTFLQCPRKYRFQYVDRVDPEFRPIALAFGSAWHHTVAVHLLPEMDGQYLSRDELHAFFRDTLVEEVNSGGPPVLFDDDEQQIGQSIALGHKMLDEFILRVPRPDKVLDVERAFILEIAHPVTGDIASVPLIGAMDAVVIDNGKPEVWELKTSKRRWSADQLELDPQPTAYTLAARELGHGEADVKMIVATKSAKQPDVQIERLARTIADQREFAETTLDVLHAINAGTDYRVRTWACRSCPFASVCAP